MSKLIWHRDFPFTDEKYHILEVEIEELIKSLENFDGLSYSRRLSTWSSWKINDTVIQSYLDYRNKDEQEKTIQPEKKTGNKEIEEGD